MRLGWRRAALALALHRLRRRSRGLEKQRTSTPSASEDERAICARPATCCLADSKDSSSLSNAVQSTVRGSYCPANGTGCLWYSSSRWIWICGRHCLIACLPACLPACRSSTSQCHVCRGCLLLLTIDRWLSVKMLFRSSSPSVRGAGTGCVVGGSEKGELSTYPMPYAHGVHSHTRNTCTKARSKRGLGCRATRQQQTSRDRAYVR